MSEAQEAVHLDTSIVWLDGPPRKFHIAVNREHAKKGWLTLAWCGHRGWAFGEGPEAPSDVCKVCAKALDRRS